MARAEAPTRMSSRCRLGKLAAASNPRSALGGIALTDLPDRRSTSASLSLAVLSPHR
jgi:hypothetical protein